MERTTGGGGGDMAAARLRTDWSHSYVFPERLYEERVE